MHFPSQRIIRKTVIQIRIHKTGHFSTCNLSSFGILFLSWNQGVDQYCMSSENISTGFLLPLRKGIIMFNKFLKYILMYDVSARGIIFKEGAQSYSKSRH